MKYKHNKNERNKSHVTTNQQRWLKRRTISRRAEGGQPSLRGAWSIRVLPPPNHGRQLRYQIHEGRAGRLTGSRSTLPEKRFRHDNDLSSQAIRPLRRAARNWMQQLRLDIVQIENRLPDTHLPIVSQMPKRQRQPVNRQCFIHLKFVS